MELNSGRFLVSIDLGPSTDDVLDAAGRLSSALGTSLKLLFCIEGSPEVPIADELLREAAAGRLDKLERRLGAQGICLARSVCHAGKASNAILEAAKQDHDVRLIIMGAGGTCDCPALGITASQVLQRAHKPVLVVRPKPVFKEILCAVDGSSASGRGLRNAITLARALEAKLTVLFVVAVHAKVGWSNSLARDMQRVVAQYEESEVAQFERFLTGFDFEGVEWSKEIKFGTPGDQAVEFAAKFDLVIIGSTGRTGFSRFLLGSTAERVSNRASCSVLTVKHGDLVTTAEREAELSEIANNLELGDRYLSQGETDKAIACFDSCLLKAPYFVPALDGLASAYEQGGEGDRANLVREQADSIRKLTSTSVPE